MATNVWTASYLLAQLKRYGFIPNNTGSGSSLTTADLCALVNDEASLYLTALIKSVRENHLETTQDITVVAGTAAYRLSSRASGNSLSFVQLLGSDGYPQEPLPQVDGARATYLGTTGTPVAFDFIGATVVLRPTPSAAGTMRVRYIQRLSRVVPEDEVGLISSINTGTNTVTISGTTPTAFVTGAVCDLVRGNPPFDTLSIDLTATVSGNDITFSSLPTGLAVGDYVAMAGETPIPQVPPELHALLSKRVALVIARATSNPNKDDLAQEVETLRAAALSLLTPRGTMTAKPIVSYSGPGWRRWSR